MNRGTGQVGGRPGVQPPLERPNTQQTDEVRGRSRSGQEVTAEPDSSPKLPRGRAVTPEMKPAYIKHRLIRKNALSPEEIASLEKSTKKSSSSESLLTDKPQKAAVAAGQDKPPEADTSPKLKSSMKPSAEKLPTSQGGKIHDKVLESHKPKTGTPSIEDSLITSDQLVAIAGKPKKDVLLFKKSPTYKAALEALDTYHKAADTQTKLITFKQVQQTSLDYLQKKRSEVPKESSATDEAKRRLAGAEALDKSVRAEQDRLLTASARKLAAKTVGAEASSLRELISSFPNHQLIDTLSQISVDEASTILNEILNARLESGEDPRLSLDFILNVRETTDIPAKEIIRQIATTVGHGGPAVSSVTAKHAFDKNVMDIGILAGAGQNSLMFLNMSGVEMEMRADAQAQIAALDESILRHSEAWKLVQDGIKDKDGNVLTTGGVKGSGESDGTPAFAKHITAQCNLVTLDCLHKAGRGDNAFSLMVKTWDSQEMKAKQIYNESIPDSKEKLRFDSSSKTLNAELAKLDVNFFKRVAAGESFLLEDMGWSLLPDGWQNDPAIIPTREQVVIDYLARNTPGIILY